MSVTGSLVTELERNLRLQDAVLKFQTVKIGNQVASAAAAPEDIEFEHLEVLDEPEPENAVARSLGLEGGDLREDFRRHAEVEGDGDDAEDGPSDLPL